MRDQMRVRIKIGASESIIASETAMTAQFRLALDPGRPAFRESVHLLDRCHGRVAGESGD
jgi:hypothetical protein